ncbi:hypothetical protein JHK82_025640 [Glycine max]|uniref:Uncharacterized protein n=1 Tax=Glycine soja TaxID=3848 RepID=A0A445J3A0_GLYSO|nr:transcription factor KUA1-like [Glycine soja]KAG5134452.1 hypothetical protein JHK82_025640 [Glycine max]KHN38855.1 Transcription factor MYB1R1 [Glycine soja]RZB92874.1 hypothetical protein D0Y65_024686 [Glycine soja]
MVLEIIDLTNSPPSSPSKSLNESVTLTSNKRIQFEHAPLPIMADTNPNLSQTNQQQTTLCPIPRQTYGPSQIVNRFPSVMQGGDVTILDPITGSNTNLVSHGARLKEPCLYESWTQGEHELFVKGLIKYGKGDWAKIAEEFVCNKTPQQVQSYAIIFFKNLQQSVSPPPPTYSYGYSSKNPTYFAPYPMSRNLNPMVDPSASNSMSMIVNQSQQLFTPVPMNVPFPLVPQYGEASTSTNTIAYGFQTHTSGATAGTSMHAIANDNKEIDLELRLGRNN